ncbi:g5014 [Coccomyxa elongata]
MERNETPVERAKSLSWLHLLAAVPILMAHVASKDLSAAAQTAAIALALMEQKSGRWEALLESHGLSLWEYELVVRMHQSHAIFEMPAIMPEAVAANYAPLLMANAVRIYIMQPTNNWNLIFCTMIGIDRGNRCKVLREALKVADDDGDDSPSICLRWFLCHAILLGGEGPSFALAEFLSMIKKARAAMEQAESWTNPKTMLPPETYWPCLGVAKSYSAAIKRVASLLQSMIQAYASSSDLDSEKRHVMCCSSYYCLASS